MKTTNICQFLIPTLFAVAAGCIEQDDPHIDVSVPSGTVTSVDRDTALGDAARELAAALENPSIRSELRQRLAARKTGDYEVLLESLDDLELPDGRSLVEAMGSARFLANVQIAAPGGVDGWNVDALPLVTFVPSEAESAELTYFDGSGESSMLPASEVPRQPVLVVGISERIGFADAAPGQLRSSGTPVYLRELVIFDTHEPWYKGDPEIFLKCDGVRFNLPDVNDAGYRYTFNQLLANLPSGDTLTCDVMEDDDDANDFVGRATFTSGRLPSSSTSTCYGQTKSTQFLMGVAKVKAWSSFTVLGQTYTYPTGCPNYYF